MLTVDRFSPLFRHISERARRASARAADDSGAFVVWSLFAVVFILLAMGLAIDVMRTEIQRTRIQTTLDTAILAAADVEQERDAQAVVNDYFQRAGIDAGTVTVIPTVGDNSKTVTARLNTRVQTMFLDMIGINSLPVPTSGTATETITDIEVALVLDNSGSMGWDDNFRLDLLKPAAMDFIDTVVRTEDDGGNDNGPGSVAVSIVPYATQVNAGGLLGPLLNFSSEHNRSHCAEFTAESFADTAMDPTAQLRRVSHFDAFTWNIPLPDPDTQADVGVVCPRNVSRHITPWSTDAEDLKDQIEAMFAWGNTSIDVATKWGAALLDPAFQPVLSQLVVSEDVDAELEGLPFPYDRDNTKKYLVIMSDGQNTSQFRLRDGYRTGASTLWRDPDTGIYSYYDEDEDRYFVLDSADLRSEPGGAWFDEPKGGAAAVNLSWQDVWAAMSVRRFARDVKAEALGGTWETYRDQIQSSTGAATKNMRVLDICDAARTNGVIIYTIGVDTYGEGDATLNECAGGTPSEPSTNFFNVELADTTADDVDNPMAAAFSSIARQINRLRLTQ